MAVYLKDFPPENLLNYDETGFVDDPGRNKVVVRKKSKHAERILDLSKINNSVMFCVSGSGEADHVWSTWTERGPLMPATIGVSRVGLIKICSKTGS